MNLKNLLFINLVYITEMESESQIDWSERPAWDKGQIHMIAGWRQWADGGSISSGLPQYLIETLGARKIGRIKPEGFYLYQTPVSQFLFRPRIKFEEGYRVEISTATNDVYWWDDGERALVIFIGDEPNVNVERYAAAFFEIVKTLHVERTVGLGGVYAMVPYDKDRTFSCSYSKRDMKNELAGYAVSFSNYEGGVSMGSYLVDLAENLDCEYFTLYGFVPMYDFAQLNQRVQNFNVEDDFRAWHDVLLRLNHMFKLQLNLTDLAARSAELTNQITAHMDELAVKHPQVPLKEYIAKVTADFVEKPFAKLDDVWEDALGDIFGD